MKSVRILGLAGTLSLIFLLSCEKDEVEQSERRTIELEQLDQLDQFGILGKWKRETITINGITDLSIQCCDFIEFETDSMLNDLNGKFKAYGVGYETSGVFELNEASDSIQFDKGHSQGSYGIQFSDDLLILSYDENDTTIDESWRKESKVKNKVFLSVFPIKSTEH